MRILFLSTNFPHPRDATVGVFNFEMMRDLARHHEVEVVAPVPWSCLLRGRGGETHSRGSGTQVQVREGMKIHHPLYYYVPKLGRRWHHVWLWYSTKRALRGTFGGKAPDVVLGYWAHPDGAVALKWARLQKCPVFNLVGGSDVLVLGRAGARRQRVLQVLSQSDAVVTVSENLKQTLEQDGVSSAHISVLRRGVDRSRFFPGDKKLERRQLGLPETLPLFLWVGRLEQVKGLDLLVESVQRCHAAGHAFQVIVIGEGSEHDRIAARLRMLGLDSVVHFAGKKPHDELPVWFRAADRVLLTSRSEGIANVLLEAHACGTPFIATRVGGVPELAVPGIDVLVDPEDAEGFSWAMQQSLAIPSAIGADLPAATATLQDFSEGLTTLMTQVVNSQRSAVVKSPERTRPFRLSHVARQILPWVVPRQMILFNGPSKSRQICLTFDDGPHPEHTPRLLDLLQRFGIPATFFLIGKEAKRFPEIVRRIAAEGHEIGNHTWSHPHLTDISSARMLNEIRRTDALIEDVIGRRVKLFRPPHGRITSRQLLDVLRLMKQHVVLWDRDTRDFTFSTMEAFRQQPDLPQPRGGNIYLMHDNRPFAAPLSERLIAQARKSGLGFSTVTPWVSSSMCPSFL